MSIKRKIFYGLSIFSSMVIPFVMISCGNSSPFKTQKSMIEAIDEGARAKDLFEELPEFMKSKEDLVYFNNINWNDNQFENNWFGKYKNNEDGENQNIWKGVKISNKEVNKQGLKESIQMLNKSNVLDFEIKDFQKNIPSDKFLTNAYRALNTSDSSSEIKGLLDIIKYFKSWLNFMRVNSQYNLLKSYQTKIYQPEYEKIKTSLNAANTQSRKIKPSDDDLIEINKLIELDWLGVILTSKSKILNFKELNITLPEIPLNQLLEISDNSKTLIYHLQSAAISGDISSVSSWVNLVNYAKLIYKSLRDNFGIYKGVSFLDDFSTFDITKVNYNELSLTNLNPKNLLESHSPWKQFSMRDFEGDINTIKNTSGVLPRLDKIFPWINGEGSFDGLKKLEEKLIILDYTKELESLSNLIRHQSSLGYLRILINHIREVYKRQKSTGVSGKKEPKKEPKEEPKQN